MKPKPRSLSKNFTFPCTIRDSLTSIRSEPIVQVAAPSVGAFPAVPFGNGESPGSCRWVSDRDDVERFESFATLAESEFDALAGQDLRREARVVDEHVCVLPGVDEAIAPAIVEELHRAEAPPGGRHHRHHRRGLPSGG